MKSAREKVSVVIPTYNASVSIVDCLRSVVEQDYDGIYEIVIVDDGSKDDTVDKIKKLVSRLNLANPKIRLIAGSHKGPSATRNIGIAATEGELVCFIDADCKASPRWIDNITRNLADQKVAGAGGAYRTLNIESAVARYVGYEIGHRHERIERNIDFVGTYSACFRKSVLAELGGFDESFLIAGSEDNDLSYRIRERGYVLVSEPLAWVWHKHPETVKEYAKQQFNRAIWRIFLYKKNPAWMRGDQYAGPKTLIQPVLWAIGAVAALVCWFFLGLIGPLLALAITFSLLIFLNFDFLAFVHRREGSVSFLALSLALRICVTMIWALGGMYGLLRLIIGPLKRKKR